MIITVDSVNIPCLQDAAAQPRQQPCGAVAVGGAARGAGLDARYANGGYRIDRAIVPPLLFYFLQGCARAAAPPAHTHVTYGSRTTRTMSADRFVHITHVFVLNPRYCRLFTHTLRGDILPSTPLSMTLLWRRWRYYTTILLSFL